MKAWKWKWTAKVEVAKPQLNSAGWVEQVFPKEPGGVPTLHRTRPLHTSGYVTPAGVAKDASGLEIKSNIK